MTQVRVADERSEKEVFSDRMFELEKRVRTQLGKGCSIAHINDHLQRVIESITKIGDSEYAQRVKAEWKMMYKTLGIEADFSGIDVINERSGFWPILMSKGVTAKLLYDGLFGFFKREMTFDFEKLVSDRTTKKRSYCVYVKAQTEVRELNISAEDIWCNGITLDEYLALVAWRDYKAKKHLDIKYRTLCAGSRLDNDRVPDAWWRESFNILRIDSCNFDTPYPDRGVREVFLS
jgi:hypothetical protein